MIAFAPDGTILDANDHFLRLMGYAEDDIIGRHHEMFLQPGEKESPAYRQFWADLLHGNCISAMFKRLGKHGREIWLQATYGPICDAEGRATKIIKFCTDIADLRMDAAESAGQLQAIDRAHAILECTLDGVILAANAHFLRIMAYGLNDIVGEPHAIFVPPEERDSAAQRALWAALRDGEFRDGEFRRIARNGREAWLRGSYNPIFDPEGKPFKVVVFATDITAQVQIREQFRLANSDLARMARHYANAKNLAEEASRAKTRFLAGMSHELRTPLNGILGYAQLLNMEGGLTGPQTLRIQAMMDAGNHLLEMISTVLDLSEIERGDACLRSGPMDIPALAEASLGIVRAAARNKGLSLKLQIAPDVPTLATADTAKIRQVLLNLLGNAVKYTGQGTVDLRIEVAPATAAPPAFVVRGQQLRFVVADTGPGIPQERRHCLFEDFERLGADAVTEGAGLGLALSKRFATVMGGSLDYRDNPGGGSLFILEVPLVEARAGISQPASEAVPAPAKGADARILVVDDVAMNREIASAFLGSAGYEVICAENGEEGIRHAAMQDFVAVLMDVRMPGMDGLEATRRIRALGGRRGAVPVVALTAQVFTEQIANCRAAGMDTHVGKPFSLENLLGAVTQVVEQRRVGAPVPMPMRITMKAPLPPALAVLDEVTLERTAALLNGSSMRNFLDTLTTRAEDLRRTLGARSRLAGMESTLAEAAHKIASSAGMFGFDRLAHAAKHFENAVKDNAPEADSLALDLESVLDASLCALRNMNPAIKAGQGLRKVS